MRCHYRFSVAILSLPLILGLVSDASFATCTGSDPCSACKSCRYCGHCAKQGGTCGVCKRAALASSLQASAGHLGQTHLSL